MFNAIHKTLSGEKDPETPPVQPNHHDTKVSKRNRSGESADEPQGADASQKRKRLNKSKKINGSPGTFESREEGELVKTDEDSSSEPEGPSISTISPQPDSNPVDELPSETPHWGIKLFELLHKDLVNVNTSMSLLESTTNQNTRDVKQLQRKLSIVEKQNESLQSENINLKERLLEVEYKQRRNNLIFDGIIDNDQESEGELISKIRDVVSHIPGLDKNFRVDKCYRLDGAYKPGKNRCIICTFNWFVDVMFILKNKKCMPRGVYVNEDLPEEWMDRRRILKPIFNAAKRCDNLKNKTHLSKDKLIIDKDTFTAGPGGNIHKANEYLNFTSMCKREDQNQTLFSGSLSPLSNLYLCSFRVNNITYNSVEQYIQSEKAALFNEDSLQRKIMNDDNPYHIKRLGSKVKNFNLNRWMGTAKQACYRAVHAKFNQNPTLRDYLIGTNDKLLVESTTNPYWGTGLHLHHKNAMDRRYWINKEGGALSDILHKIRHDLRRERT